MTLSTCFKGLQDGSAVKNPPANAGGAGEAGSVPELRRSPGAGNGNPLLGKIFTWEIPWTEEPGGLQSMVLQRVGYDCGNSVRLFCQTKSLQMVIAAMKLKDAYSLEGKL